MNRTLPAAILALAALPFASGAKELDGVYTPAQNACPSVEEAIKKMKVPDGYEVRNFASEPMVINPVAMTWDHRGRLWVVELYEYPRGAKTPNEYSKIATDENFRPVVKTDANSPRDRVIVLEDTDNDGKADKRTVFAEGLNLATGILCGYDGVFVGQAPNLFFFRDTNGDDKADEYKTILTGFGMEDRHELLNSFTWGPDGYMYFTHGVFTHSKVRRPGEPDEKGNTLNAGVYRVRFSAGRAGVPPAPDGVPPSGNAKGKPSGGTPSGAGGTPALPNANAAAPGPSVAFHEVYADGTSNPWGVDFDARGNAFVSACVIDHLFHVAPGGIYQRQGGAPENPYAYELLPSIVDFKHFRAAYAGIQIYQGGIYPPDTHGHVFIGNIHDNAVHEESLTPVGATFKAAPVRDFIRANDGWFRPVSTQTGPDGFLWIMDWCDKYPCYQNAQANPEGVDREHGRIWRVCYTGSEEGKKMAGMSRESNFHVGLDHPNNWVRRMAARLIIQSGNDGQRENLARVAQTAKSVDVRLNALRTLPALYAEFIARVEMDGGPGSTWPQHLSEFANQFRDDPDPAVRECFAASFVVSTKDEDPKAAAGMLSGRFSGDTLLKLASDPDAGVRRTVASRIRRNTTGRLTTVVRLSPVDIRPEVTALITASAVGDDKTLALLIWMDLEPYFGAYPGAMLPWLADLAPKTKPLSQILTYKTARRITDTRKPENMDLLMEFLDKIKGDDVLTAQALDGMLKAQEAGAVKPAKADPAALFAHWQASKNGNVRSLAGRLGTLWGDKAAVAALIKLAEDPKTDPARRAEAIKTLRKLNSDEARAALLRILEQSIPQ